MSEHDIKALAKALAGEIGKHTNCPVFPPETIAFLNDLAALWKNAKATAVVTLVGLVVTAVAYAVWDGIKNGRGPK